MFKNILQPVFSEKPYNNLLLKARIHMPTYVGSSREQHCNRNFPPDSTFDYQLDSALEGRHHLSQKAQQKPSKYI